VTLNDIEFAALSPTAISSGTLIDGGDTSTTGLAGIKATRATANLPQTATVDIFSITGRIWVTNIVATVTTIIQTQATTLKLVYTPTGGSVGDLTAATTDWTAAAVGQQFVAKLNTITDVLTKSPVIGMVLPPVEAQQPQIMLSAGKISALTVASSTGQARWDLWYVPLDAGTVVTPL
jgi:hypothetical protein